MKKMRVITGLAVSAIVVSFLVLYSCSKQDESMITTEKANQEKDYTVYNKISSFSEKMDFYKTNPAYKSSESIEVDSALWLMEGAVNLTYGFPFEEYGEFTSGDATLVLQKNQAGEIELDEVAVKYQQLIEEAREDYYNSGFEDKGLYLIDIEKTGEDANTVNVSVSTITGNRGIDLGPFTPNDHWWYGEDEGGCSTNTQPDSDAAQELAKAYPKYDMNECMAIASPASCELIGGQPWLRRPNDPLDNHYDYYIYFTWDATNPFNFDDDCCIVAQEMAAYYSYLNYVITDLARSHFNISSELVFINFWKNVGYHVTQGGGEGTTYLHNFGLTYALPFEKPNCEPPIEL